MVFDLLDSLAVQNQRSFPKTSKFPETLGLISHWVGLKNPNKDMAFVAFIHTVNWDQMTILTLRLLYLKF